VAKAAARRTEGVLADPPPRALVAGLGDSAVLLGLFWIHSPTAARPSKRPTGCWRG